MLSWRGPRGAILPFAWKIIAPKTRLSAEAYFRAMMMSVGVTPLTGRHPTDYRLRHGFLSGLF